MAWAAGRVAATTVHGLFEHPAIVEHVLGESGQHALHDVLEHTFERLADAVDEHLDTDLLLRLVGD